MGTGKNSDESKDNSELSNIKSTTNKLMNQPLSWGTFVKMISLFVKFLQNDDESISKKSLTTSELYTMIEEQGAIIEEQGAMIKEQGAIIEELKRSTTKLAQFYRDKKTDIVRTHVSISGQQTKPNNELIDNLETFAKNKLTHFAKNISQKQFKKEKLHRLYSQLCEIILVNGMKKVIKKEYTIDSLQLDVENALIEMGVELAFIRNKRNSEHLIDCLKQADEILTEIKDSTMQGELYWIYSNTSDENQFEDEKHTPISDCKSVGKIEFMVYPGYFTKNEFDEKTYHLKATVWTELEEQS